MAVWSREDARFHVTARRPQCAKLGHPGYAPSATVGGRLHDAAHALAAGATRRDVLREFSIARSQVKSKFGDGYKHEMKRVRNLFTPEFSEIWQLNERIEEELTRLEEDGATTATTPTPQAWTWRTGSVRLTQGPVHGAPDEAHAWRGYWGALGESLGGEVIWIASYDAETIEAMHRKGPETNQVLHIDDAALWREGLWVLLLHGCTRVKNAGLNGRCKKPTLGPRAVGTAEAGVAT